MKAMFPPARILSLTIFAGDDGVGEGNGKQGVSGGGW
jgi:hypothetical protein